MTGKAQERGLSPQLGPRAAPPPALLSLQRLPWGGAGLAPHHPVLELPEASGDGVGPGGTKVRWRVARRAVPLADRGGERVSVHLEAIPQPREPARPGQAPSTCAPRRGPWASRIIFPAAEEPGSARACALHLASTAAQPGLGPAAPVAVASRAGPPQGLRSLCLSLGGGGVGAGDPTPGAMRAPALETH